MAFSTFSSFNNALMIGSTDQDATFADGCFPETNGINMGFKPRFSIGYKPQKFVVLLLRDYRGYTLTQTKG